MAKQDPCLKVEFNGQTDRFFSIPNLSHNRHGVLHCKVQSKANKYQTYAIIDQQSFDQFNNHENDALHLISFNAKIKKTEK